MPVARFPPGMSAGLVLALVLATSTPSPERDAASAELEGVAVRIEQLKARYAAGDGDVVPELQRLLVRAQELAITIDHIDHAEGQLAGRPPFSRSHPTSDELRERADAARDEADRIRSALENVEARIAEIQAGGRAPQARLASAEPGHAGNPSALASKLALLDTQRARLLRSLAATTAKADRLEAEARLLDGMK